MGCAVETVGYSEVHSAMTTMWLSWLSQKTHALDSGEFWAATSGCHRARHFSASGAPNECHNLVKLYWQRSLTKTFPRDWKSKHLELKSGLFSLRKRQAQDGIWLNLKAVQAAFAAAENSISILCNKAAASVRVTKKRSASDSRIIQHSKKLAFHRNGPGPAHGLKHQNIKLPRIDWTVTCHQSANKWVYTDFIGIPKHLKFRKPPISGTIPDEATAGAQAVVSRRCCGLTEHFGSDELLVTSPAVFPKLQLLDFSSFFHQ